MNRGLTIGLIMAVVFGICISFPSAGSAGDVLIITNKSVPASSISKVDIKKIFTGKKTRWENDQKINFIIQQGGSTHEQFLRTYVQRTPAQYSRYWKKQVFTGKGRRPTTVSTDEAVIEYVAGTEGAIGYISTESATSKVNIISIKAN